MQLTMQLKE